MVDVQSFDPHHKYEIQFHMRKGKIKSWIFESESERDQAINKIDRIFVEEI
jgi:hypothetical protein